MVAVAVGCELAELCQSEDFEFMLSTIFLTSTDKAVRCS